MTFRVIIVDDSRLVRKAVRDILESQVPLLEVVGEAANGQEGLDLIDSLHPDLVILDVEMPLMDGLTMLRRLKERTHRPDVIMLSVLTRNGAQISFQALDLGALDFVPKPAPGSGLYLEDIEQILVARVNGIIQTHNETDYNQLHSERFQQEHLSPHVDPGKKRSVLAIGSSTGGPQALQQIFSALPHSFPVPILVVQHMPPVFTAAFAERLDKLSELHIVEAKDGMEIRPGNVYLAPGNFHMSAEGMLDPHRISIKQTPPVNGHRPSVDVLFNSVTNLYGDGAVALIMTGMGWDGARGIKGIMENGGYTIAQDEQSSVVFGMNRRAIEMGGINRVVPLKNVVDVLLSCFMV